jgi:hypothetical protein
VNEADVTGPERTKHSRLHGLHMSTERTAQTERWRSSQSAGKYGTRALSSARMRCVGSVTSLITHSAGSRISRLFATTSRITPTDQTLVQPAHSLMPAMTMAKCPCPYKGVYSTEKRAKHAAAVRGKKNGVKLNVYKCPGCRGWHLTSQRREVEAA